LAKKYINRDSYPRSNNLILLNHQNDHTENSSMMSKKF